MRRAAWLTLAAFVVSAAALGLRPQLFGMALFAIILLLVTDRRAHPRAALGRAGHRPGLGQHPRQLLPRPARARPGLAGGPARPRRAAAPRVARRRGRGAGGVRDAVRTRGLGVRRRPVDEPGGHERGSPSGSRPRCATVAGILFFASALAVVALLARRGRPTPWPTLAWLGVFFVIGAYAARGVAWWPLGAVAAVAGPARDLVDATPRAPERRRHAADAPAQPGRRRRDRARRRRPAAGLAADRPRPGRAAGVVGNAPSGITAALARPRRARLTGCSTRSRGARGSSSPCPTCPSRSTRGSSSSRSSVWDAYDERRRGRRGLGAAARRLGRHDRRRRRQGTGDGEPSRGRRLAGVLHGRGRVHPARPGPVDPSRLASSTSASPGPSGTVTAVAPGC